MPTSSAFESASDDELLRAIAAGGREAFVELFLRRRLSVYRFAVHITGAPSAAEDVTQDVFLTVMREAQAFDDTRGSVLAWLLGIARNHARRRRVRDRWLQPMADHDAEVQSRAASMADPVEALERAARIEDLRRALKALPLRYREVIVLCDLEELSYADAASALNLPVGTVRSRLHRGRALLAARLRKISDGPQRPEIALA